MLPVLSKDKLFKLAPSIFTQASSYKTSTKYSPISTEQIIDKLMSEGFSHLGNPDQKPEPRSESICKTHAPFSTP